MAKHGGVKDSGEYFVINPTSRKVTVPNAHKSIGTVGDHNSEQITFMCPQIVDGHDISQCASRSITWANALGEHGEDGLGIVEVEQGTEGMIYLSWTIRNPLTVAKGIVQFSVHFEDKDATGTIYRWSTATCKDCDILDSINDKLGVYEAMYVAGDTLVIADYTLVKDDSLELDSNAIVPDGILNISANGNNISVREYAEVNVNVPNSPNDPNLKPENIKKGVKIFNVDGQYDPIGNLNSNYITVKNDTSTESIRVMYSKVLDGRLECGYKLLHKGDSFGDWMIPSTIMCIVPEIDEAEALSCYIPEDSNATSILRLPNVCVIDLGYGDSNITVRKA